MAQGERRGYVGRVEPADYIATLADRSQALLGVAAAHPDAVVESCPGWTVTDVLRHCAGTWGWAAAIVRSGKREDWAPAPEVLQGEELVAWGRSQASAVLEALRQADPEANCWTFGLPRTTRFWFRRQALETAVHAWDVESAIGEPAAIEPAVAADGIDEFLRVMVSRTVERHPDPWTGQSVHLHRTDGDGEWLIRLGPDGQTTIEEAHAKGDVALRGSASSLYLWCLNRLPIDALEAFGDLSVAERWQAEIRF